MRDILITLFVMGLIPMIIRRPAVGALAWAWISMMNPHKMAFGFAATLPFAQLIAATTLLSFLFGNRKKPLPIQGGTVLLVLLVVWMTVTSVVSINSPQVVWDRWFFVIKIHFMLMITLMLLRGREHINQLIWVMVISLGIYGVKGGFFTVVTAGGGRVWGPPGGMLAGNNEFAVGLIVMVPLMYYLYQASTHKWIRRGLVVSMMLVALAILGTQSRGALLGLIGMAAMLGLKSKYPVRSLLALGALLLCAIAFMPATWTERMDTIQGYQGDTSAMSRIWTWNTLWNVAMDRPLFGAGFGAEDPAIFARYAPTGPEFEIFQGKFWVAHSIYFQALGEHGFPGLLIYVSIGFWIWWAAGHTAKEGRANPELEAWVPMLMRMCQVSVLGFAIGGAFLSLMNLDVPYYLMAIVVLTRIEVKASRPSTRVATALA
jgi:probable O-glycosylation ligase (exosortase A-associated)